MKKFIFAASLLATTFFSAKAQDASTTTTSTDGYKPSAGDVTAEFGITSGGGLFPGLQLTQQVNSKSINDDDEDQPVNTLSPVLRFRYFLADDLALRVGLNLSSRSRTEKFRSETTTTPAPEDPIVDGERKFKSSLVLLNLGAEKHFSGTERLDTYIGADLLFAIAGASEEGDNIFVDEDDDVVISKGSSYEIKGIADGFSDIQAGFGFGLRLVGGADYYIAKKLYLGGEFGWGFMSFKGREIEGKSTFVDGDETESFSFKAEGNTTFQLMPSLVAGIKVGFVF